jgi:anion-transporting  ArsA/GET3 family ATPase
MLRAPRTYGEIARVGPIRRQADKISELVRDSARTGFLAVALPEEMPVTETLELETRLADQVGGTLDAIVVNGMYPQRFKGAEAKALERAARDGLAPDARAAVDAALSEHRRARAQQGQLRRLRRGTDAPVVTLPFLFEPEVELEGVQRLARELERRLRALGRGSGRSVREK